ncbi:hypothetical protein [Aquimarina brevivitae]|uniref:Uncharacterized protein n=1 Tax=Aquimarina brevivitae TaxID=323412 RepID=A0A4Q7PJS7_9FLAO|nr:hypothetical protein [Aquimarina brevivitae]RZT00309.1 hypothetical protein EV197_1545 [Aquimarina brevivitae]
MNFIKTLLVCFIVCFSDAALKAQEAITIEFLPIASTKEVQQLYDFEGVERLDLKVNGIKDQGTKILIITKTFWNEKLTKTDTISRLDINRILEKDGSILLTFLSKQTKDVLKSKWYIKRSWTDYHHFELSQKTYIKELTKQYFIINPYGERKEDRSTNRVTLFIYSSPYFFNEDPSVMIDGNHPYTINKWMKLAEIEHFIEFELHILP